MHTTQIASFYQRDTQIIMFATKRVDEVGRERTDEIDLPDCLLIERSTSEF